MGCVLIESNGRGNEGIELNIYLTSSTYKDSFILERKRTRKLRRFQTLTLFPICVFILQQQKDQRKKSHSHSLLCQYK